MTQPPRHPQNPKILEKFESKRTDPYFWMRERDSKPVLEALDEERKYFENFNAKFAPITEQLFTEMKSRVADEDIGAPIEYKKNFYFEKFIPGAQYPLLYSRSRTGDETQLLDFEKLASGHTYFDVGNWKFSADETILAYSIDFVGRRFYTVFFFDVVNQTHLPHKLENVTNSFFFGRTSHDIYFTKQHLETLRHNEVYYLDLTTGDQSLLFTEADEKFWVGLSRSTSPGCLFISVGSTTTSEVHYIDLVEPQTVKLFCPRKVGHEYAVADGGDNFYILSNLKAKNFSIFTCAKHSHKPIEQWREIIPGRSDVLLEGLTVFANHFVVEQRSDGLEKIDIYDRQTLQVRQLPTLDAAYSMGLQAHRDYYADHISFAYQSLHRPLGLFHCDLISLATKTVWERKVPNFDAAKYESRRIWIQARDGTKVPVTLVVRKGFEPLGQAPMLLYGYGSYGHSLDATFSVSKLSLVDRGWVYAIAHVRGGSEMGRHWYEDGRQLKKMNTFTDYIDAAKELIALKYCDPKRLFAMGGSAGGLLMGAVINAEPKLFKAVLASVPFVDVVSTMLDDTLPLTTGEYEEWGNPNEKEYYDYILNYSPYDNLKNQEYPHMLITSGYHDSQVQYWEPLKWVAKLRDHTTSGKPILLDMNREAGHGGATGRYSYLKEIAKEYAFLIWRESQEDTSND